MVSDIVWSLVIVGSLVIISIWYSYLNLKGVSKLLIFLEYVGMVMVCYFILLLYRIFHGF